LKLIYIIIIYYFNKNIYILISCGKLFCDMHTNFSMRLSESAKPDPNSPNWYKVCQSCYTSREGYNNTEGIY